VTLSALEEFSGKIEICTPIISFIENLQLPVRKLLHHVFPLRAIFLT